MHGTRKVKKRILLQIPKKKQLKRTIKSIWEKKILFCELDIIFEVIHQIFA